MSHILWHVALELKIRIVLSKDSSCPYIMWFSILVYLLIIICIVCRISRVGPSLIDATFVVANCRAIQFTREMLPALLPTNNMMGVIMNHAFIIYILHFPKLFDTYMGSFTTTFQNPY